MARLSEELTSAEDQIAQARQQYDDAVLDYNNRRGAISTVLLAGILRFGPAVFFVTATPQERHARRISFDARAPGGW